MVPIALLRSLNVDVFTLKFSGTLPVETLAIKNIATKLTGIKPTGIKSAKAATTKLSLMVGMTLSGFMATPWLATHAQLVTQPVTQPTTQTLQPVTQHIELLDAQGTSLLDRSIVRTNVRTNIRTNVRTNAQVNGLLVLGIAVAGSVAIGLGLSAIVERDRSSQTRFRSPVEQNSQFHLANPNLQGQLLRLLHGDRGAASRLFDRAKLKYPGQSANWYVEKVIFDLKRDRGRY